MKKYKDKINFYDCDPAGILFFANIYKIAHKAYESFLLDISPERDFFSDGNILLPIIHSEADYIKPLTPGNKIEIEVSVSILRQSSFELTYNVLLDDDLCAKVKTVHVAVDKKSFSKTNLPGNLKDSLFAHTSSS